MLDVPGDDLEALLINSTDLDTLLMSLSEGKYGVYNVHFDRNSVDGGIHVLGVKIIDSPYTPKGTILKVFKDDSPYPPTHPESGYFSGGTFGMENLADSTKQAASAIDGFNEAIEDAHITEEEEEEKPRHSETRKVELD